MGSVNIKQIFFDTETSGLDCRNCKIIELAMLVVENGKIIEEYDEFINIGERIDSKIITLTGITNDMLVNEGINEEDVAKDIKGRLSSGTLMIAHNCQFDLSFIYNLLKRHYPYEADEIVKKVNWLDTLTILRDRKDYPHKFTDALRYYGISDVNFHRAIDDAKALYKVYLAMKTERDDLGEYVNVFGYNPRYGVNGVRFSFIDYKLHYFNNGRVSPSNILPRKYNNTRREFSNNTIPRRDSNNSKAYPSNTLPKNDRGMKFCPKCNGMMLPRKVGYYDDAQIVLKCSTCGYGSFEEELNDYCVHKEINSKDNVISYDDKSSEEFLKRYPNCNERRKREYRKGIRYDGFYVNPEDDDIYYDDFDY